jgi:TolB-like protein/DNA-binding winged helix-turn-helix (wHTH) protein/cytochrome c-type biogenesis protein CcmH/NrfG
MKTVASSLLEFGEFRLDLDEHRLFRADGTEVSLTPRVFQTLRYLVEHAGRIVDKRSIMEAVWSDCIVEENNLAQAISKLRQVLGKQSAFIVTVPGRGYRFVAEVIPGRVGVPPAGFGVPPKQSFDDAPGRAAGEKFVNAGTCPPAGGTPTLPGRSASSRYVLVAGALFLLAGIGFYIWSHGHSVPNESSPVPPKSIAVLPFANLSGDPENAYFSEGIKDEILTRLAKIATLKVISRTSTQEFATTNRNVREIARRLGVAYILEGSVQRSSENVRVTVQLIEAGTDHHVWAETYDRRLVDMFQVETEVAQHIARALSTALSAAEGKAVAARPTRNVEAYHAYLRGRHFWNQRTLAGFKQATEQFSRALELDPNYAQAFVGLADALQFGNSDDAAATRAGELLREALTLDETMGEAHASLGLLTMNYYWDWPQAEAEFRRALELNPNYATAHQWYGEFLVYMGRFEEAINEMTRARELDPLSLIINTDLGKVYSMARRYDEAIAQYHAALQLDPGFSEALGLLALTHSMANRHEEALAEIEKVRELRDSPSYLSWHAWVQHRAGLVEEARQSMEALSILSRRMYVSPLWIATGWIGLGDKEEAFRCFEQVFAEHAIGGAIGLKVNPLFDTLRSDPRFDELVRRAKL